MSSIANTEGWIKSIRRALTDWHAPAWLVSRFAGTPITTRAVLAIPELIFRWRGHGGVLAVSLRSKGLPQ